MGSPVSQRPSLRLRLTHGWPMAMLATTPTLMEATEPMVTGTPMLTMVSTTARGLLRLSLRAMLRLTPTTTVPTDLATTDSATEPMDMELTPMLTMVSTTARGLLRLSLRPMLRLTPTTTVPTDLAT